MPQYASHQRLVLSQLARKIDTEGYDWIYAEYGIEAPREKKAAHRPASTIGSCAVRNAAEAEAKK